LRITIVTASGERAHFLTRRRDDGEDSSRTVVTRSHGYASSEREKQFTLRQIAMPSQREVRHGPVLKGIDDTMHSEAVLVHVFMPWRT
jgi:hypothetical protein